MSTFYDDASLIMYPSGYKANKIYSLKPTNGSGDFDFTRASTATRVNADGLIESVASGVPRIDYTGGGCGKLLLEPQRSNLVNYSEAFDNAWWTKSGASVTSGFNSPDGTTNAFKLVEDTATSVHSVVSTQIAIALSTSYSMSCIAKANGRNWVKMTSWSGHSLFYDLANVATGTATGGATGTIKPLANGFYRLTMTYTSAAIVEKVFIFLGDADNSTTYTGDGTSGVYIYGAQLEEGSYPTSYIPSAGSQTTRSADAAYKTGVSSLIGQTEGTIFAEFTYNGVANSGVYEVIIELATDVNNLISVIKNNTTSELYVFVQNGGVIQVNSVGISGTNIIGTHKVALGYKLNDYVVYLDGVQVFTDTSATVPACSGVFLGQAGASTGQLGGGINQALLFKTKLSNAQLTEITTL